MKSVFLSDIDLAERYCIHRGSPWRWVKLGKFPKPVKMNGLTRWKLSDVEAWEAKQEKAS